MAHIKMKAALRAVSGAQGGITVSKALRRQPVRLPANRTEPVETGESNLLNCSCSLNPAGGSPTFVLSSYLQHALPGQSVRKAGSLRGAIAPPSSRVTGLLPAAHSPNYALHLASGPCENFEPQTRRPVSGVLYDRTTALTAHLRSGQVPRSRIGHEVQREQTNHCIYGSSHCQSPGGDRRSGDRAHARRERGRREPTRCAAGPRQALQLACLRGHAPAPRRQRCHKCSHG